MTQILRWLAIIALTIFVLVATLPALHSIGVFFYMIAQFFRVSDSFNASMIGFLIGQCVGPGLVALACYLIYRLIKYRPASIVKLDP
jgi:hypothetical protein